MAYLDLHQHLKNLEEHGLLRRITRLINKDTELHPLVRWQYRGLSEEERKACFLSSASCWFTCSGEGDLSSLPKRPIIGQERSLV